MRRLVDNSLHSETYGAVTGCLFGVFLFLKDWVRVSLPVAQLWLKISRSLQVALLPRISFVIESGPEDFFPLAV